MANTSPIQVEVANSLASNRTSPLYIQEKNKLSLQDILKEKPSDFNGQIDISWLHNALNQKAIEMKYSPWDAVNMPSGLWVASSYGNRTIIVISSDGKICTSSDFGASWKKSKLTYNLAGIVYGNGYFIAVTRNGKCFKTINNGSIWQESFVCDDTLSCITYHNHKFIACSTTGKIYISENNGESWQKVYENDSIQISKIIHSEKIVVAIGYDSEIKAIYSIDNCTTFKEMENIPLSTISSTTYGDNKFIMCSDSSDILYITENDLLNNKYNYHNININYQDHLQYNWVDIAFGSGVFVLASSSGIIMASYDGIRWINTPSHKGNWQNILKTDYFFIIFSIAEENNNLNAIRSSNGGLTNIMFASLNDVIENENVNKAINSKTLKDYLNYRTGKNKSQYPIYSDNLLIECTSLDTNQIKIININNESDIVDADDIKTSSLYIIKKEISNLPNNKHKHAYLLVMKDNSKIYQFASDDNLFTTYYHRVYENNWTSWQQKLFNLSSGNISISENILSYSDINTFLVDSNNIIKKVDKTIIDDNIKDVVIKNINAIAGNTTIWNETRDYNLGATVLGSDNALYYCIKENNATNNKNPVSSRDYWLQIINSSGKINIDNLSQTLGSYAFLNSLALTDDKITGILPVSKGGTGLNDGFGWKNIYSSTEFNKKLGLIYPFTTQQFIDAIITLNKPLFCSVYGLSRYSGFSDLPGNVYADRLIINYKDNNHLTLELFDPYTFATYICCANQGIASAWIKTRNNDGSIPVAIGGTGLTGGALGKPTTATKLQPTQANGTSYKSGDTIYRYSNGSNATAQYVPSGGSWLVKSLVFNISTGKCAVELGNVYIVPGGATLDTSYQYNFIHILTKIA